MTRRRVRGKSFDPLEAWIAPPQLKIRRGHAGHIEALPPLAQRPEAEDDGCIEAIVTKMVVRRRSHIRAEQFGLDPQTYVTMLRMKLPAGLLNVSWWLRKARASSARDLDFIEWFAGIGNIHAAMELAGYASVKCDIDFDREAHDVICKEGMLHSCQLVRRLRRGGLETLGTVCSSWVFMSRSSTGRYEFAPLGVLPRSAVVEGANRMVAFMSLIMLWSTALSCSFILEQPATSIMYLHPRMQQVAAWFGDSWSEVRTYMGAFGAPTPKPTILYSGHRYVKSLARTLTKEQKKGLDPDVEMSTRDEMTGAVTGGKDLKKSQAYPVEYGQAVQAAFSRHDVEVIDSDGDQSDGTVDEDLCTLDPWADAGMVELCQWLGVPADRLVL